MSLKIICPICNKEFRIEDPGFRGTFQFPCPEGHYVTVRLPATASTPQDAPGHTWAVILDGRRIELPDGEYTIGRHAPDSPSDISVPSKDTSASRRCARLTVKGLEMKLIVVRTKNPLLLEGRSPLKDGETAIIKPGGSVTVGTTPLRFVYS